MLQNVKNTTLNWLFNLLMPHYCSSCGEIGQVLCGDCKYDITSQKTIRNIEPKPGLPNPDDVFNQIYITAFRGGLLENLVNKFKFQRCKDLAPLLADILACTLPRKIPHGAILVTIPTIPKHIRVRGYDHMQLITKHLSDSTRLKRAYTLRRRTGSMKYVQHRSNKLERNQQAMNAFYADETLDGAKTYILVDDVVTTGATALYAAQALHQAGAKDIWLLALTRQRFKN